MTENCCATQAPAEQPDPVPYGRPTTAVGQGALTAVRVTGDFTVREAVNWLPVSVKTVDAGVEALPVSCTVICGL